MREKYIPKVKSINEVSSSHYEVVYEETESHDSIGTMKRIAMFTTGEARAIMIRSLGSLYNKGLMHDVYYMDTDSFFLSHRAYNYLNSQKLIDANELGKFKN